MPAAPLILWEKPPRHQGTKGAPPGLAAFDSRGGIGKNVIPLAAAGIGHGLYADALVFSCLGGSKK